MRILSLVALVAALLVALMSSPAEAKNTTLCYKAHGLREAVVKKHGARAPGRNICRLGMKGGKAASTRQKARYVRTLRSLIAPPPPMLVRTAVAPRRAPAGTLSPGVAAGGTLSAIARCESGGDPTAVSPSGQYRGKYQFDRGTWASVGGSGDPAAAPEAEQDARAAALMQRSGHSPWPVCG